MGASSVVTVPVSQPVAKHPELEFLSDSSPADKPADDHKAWAEKMSEALGAAGLGRESVRVRDCAESLFFHLKTDQSTGEILFRLRSAPYCHYRHCPVCQWRRSLRNKAIVMSALPSILEQYPTARFAMLTLTVRNCHIGDLRSTILAMNQGRKRLMKRQDWPALGWICAVEVTRGKDGPMRAHPHLHLLLMLPAGYFTGRGYVPTREWSKRWREAMRLDYDPSVDIRVIRLKKGAESLSEKTADWRLPAIQSAVSEVVKYATKASDLLQGGKDWLRQYVEQVHGLKFLTSGGVLKGIMKTIKEGEGEDLVHVNGEDEDQESEVFAKVNFHWRTKHQRYARKRSSS